MLTDIEKLIERLRRWVAGADNVSGADLVTEAADALTRLVAPLPAEVAEEARYLRMLAKAAVPDLPHVTLPDSLRDIADMLESLARENARLAEENDRLRAELEAANWRASESQRDYVRVCGLLDAKQGGST